MGVISQLEVEPTQGCRSQLKSVNGCFMDERHV